jgi:hypothetical protein
VIIPPPAQFPSSPSNAEVTVPQEPRISTSEPTFITSQLSIDTDDTGTTRPESGTNESVALGENYHD